MAKEINKGLSNLWKDVSANQKDIADIKLKRIELDTYTVTNVSQTITVVTKLNMMDYWKNSYRLELIQPFNNMPSWGLTGVHPIILFYSESQIIDPVIYGNAPMYPLLQGSNRFSYQVVNRWQYLDGQYILRIVINQANLRSLASEYWSLYLDLDILIENPRKYSSQQGYKS